MAFLTIALITYNYKCLLYIKDLEEIAAVYTEMKICYNISQNMLVSLSKE